MSRPLRIQYAGALYHVTSRGNERRAMYREDADFQLFLDTLAEVCERFNWVIHSFCLMTNHYHLMVETPDANLSKGMRQLNGVYTVRFNRKYGRVGHLFQGRYKAILVDKDAYLMELSRYVVLNPVRAKMVKSPDEWPWSSYCYTTGLFDSPGWLATDATLRYFGNERDEAILKFARFVAEGVGVNIWEHLKQQIYLGSDEFINAQLAYQPKGKAALSEVPHKQRRKTAAPLSHFLEAAYHRDEAIVSAFQSGGYSLKEIADYVGLHYSTVSRIVRKA
ncbi:transposase [uncultured Endozoicomonas sp.]|uniref:transposase n=1 Tax=uncultured Endozoicomonas sp. TaxID=432652 RepID=UPI0026356D9D|nr:transposase [uncultured Endozoicomonas sp.]